MSAQVQAIARGVLESIDDGRIVLVLPNSDYQLHLVLTDEAGDIRTRVGKRIKGVIAARALRMHAAKGGGRFIEPVWGAPRIVAGTVLAVDESARSVVVDVAVPIQIAVLPEQDLSQVHEGMLVNFYVESGATFTPVG